MRFTKAWLDQKSGIAGLVTMILSLLWPSIPLGGLNVWIETMFDKWYTVLLYPLVSFLAGSFAAVYVYTRSHTSSCRINPVAGASASIAGVLLGACPACIPFLAFFLPLSITITLSYFSWVFMVLSIAVLLLLIDRIGGFEEECEAQN